MKLLLADDDADQLELRALALTKAGFSVATALDEKSALRIAGEQRPAVAVVDLRMPTQDAGLRVIKGLKKLDPEMRIILLSGVDPKSLVALPEWALVEHSIIKGNATKQLVEYLKKSFILEVKVIPRSSNSEIVHSPADGVWRVKLRGVPEKGLANEELIGLLAEHFAIRREAVAIVSGKTSQRKRVRISRD